MSTEIEFSRSAQPAQTGGMLDVAQTRAAQEVQAAMVVAKRFPRDEQASFARIMAACKRPTLAEAAIYVYPRGGQKVEGPSIRLAEALAQAWGNLSAGVVELTNDDGESSVLSYAWDLETNTRVDKVFTVKHERHSRKGVTKLDDPRDVYEMTANQAARRLRACILAVIPGDVVEAAVNECRKTLAGGSKEPLADRARKMVGAFAELGVTLQMIEDRLGHKLDAIDENELVTLRGIFQGIRDGMSSREDHFKPPARSRQTTMKAAAEAVHGEIDKPYDDEESRRLDAEIAKGEELF